MKDKIILNILLFLETKDLQYKHKAIDLLPGFAKDYTTPLKIKASQISLYEALKMFIGNKEGYAETIVVLWSALKRR
ncbi:MAG: hypothetical protein HN347_12300 [Bacteroidetes bacterium]|jgi:hypothetical protein|nr:hypothetical protein [Bacteroidota bacterium]